MKPFSLLLLATAALTVLPSCDKARDLADDLRKKETATPAAPYSGSLVSEITEADYHTFRKQPGRVIVIDFHADWCGPCRQLAPILQDIATEHQGLVLIGKINVDHAPALASQEGVQGIPDVRIFRDGKQVDRFVGLPSPAEVRRKIESHLKNLPPLAPEAPGTSVPKPAEPVTQPMSKDWLPPGVQRR